jgi:hypothetical protein
MERGLDDKAIGKAITLFIFANQIPGPFPITTWNDAPERTHAEVLAAFDKAIALAKAGA